MSLGTCASRTPWALTNCRHFLPSPAGISRGHPAPERARRRWGPGQHIPRTSPTRLVAAHHRYEANRCKRTIPPCPIQSTGGQRIMLSPPTDGGGGGMRNGLEAESQGKGVARESVTSASLGDGFQSLQGGKFLFPSHLQLPCCGALPSYQSTPDCPAGGRPDTPASWGAFSRGFQVRRVPSSSSSSSSTAASQRAPCYSAVSALTPLLHSPSGGFAGALSPDHTGGPVPPAP